MRKALRHKVQRIFTMLLLVCLCSQSVTPVFAIPTAGGHTTSKNHADVNPNYLVSMQQNLAVMLYDGENREFVLDRDELTASLSTKTGEGYKTPKYVKYFNDNYKDMSVSKAYAQIFKRTQVSWEEDLAKASLMLIGPDNYWGRNTREEGPGGITYDAMGGSWSRAEYEKHRMGYDPYDCKAKLYTHNLKYDWPWSSKSAWTNSFDDGDESDGVYDEIASKIPNDSNFYEPHPNGNGLFKQQIITYLKDYFEKDGKVTEKPDAFFKRLVDESTDKQKRTAYRIWAYIGAGAESIAENVAGEAPNDRWSKVFEGSTPQFNADTVFIGTEGLYELDANNNPVLINGEEDARVYENIGAYLDTLLTLYLMAMVNDKPNVAIKYLDTAKYCFLVRGKYVTKLTNIRQSRSIIFDTWTCQCYGYVGRANRGTAVTHTDNWGAYLRVFHDDMKTPEVDFRSNTIYNDYAAADNYKASMAKDSVKFQDWTSKVKESTDRIGIRLSLLDEGTMSQASKNRLKDTKIDISVNSIFLPGLDAYGVTATSLGRSAKASENDKIYAGLKSYTNGGWNHGYSGFDTTTKLDTVGGQFAIFMFAQGFSEPPIEGTLPTYHDLSVTVGKETDVTVKPNVKGLQKTINLTYSLGNALEAATKTSSKKVGYDALTFDNTYKWLKTNQEKDNIKLYARTYATKKVTAYKLDTLWIADKIANKKAVVPTANIKPDTKEKNLPKITTKLGYSTVSKSKFESETKGWTEVPLAKYKSYLSASNLVLFTYKDESFKTKQWAASSPMPKEETKAVKKQTESSKVVEDDTGTTTITTTKENKTVYTYTPGYDYYLEVEYEVDTQFKIAKKTSGEVFYKENYTDKKGASIEGLSAAVRKESPILYSSTLKKKYESTTGKVKFRTKLEAKKTNAVKTKTKVDTDRVDKTPPEPNTLQKDTMKYAVYSSSPEAYAELKNWGVASANEPGDTTGLGDGRSPVDTQLGVSGATASNGSSVINEDYEVMAGVPSTEKLYLAIGGSEFIVDIAVQYVPNETAVRTYITHFDGVASQYNYASASGAGGDIPDDTVWGNYAVPQPKGLKSGVTATVTTSNGNKSINPHKGGSYTLTIKGTIHNDGVDGKKVISDHDGGTYPYPYGNGKGSDSNFAPRAAAVEQGSNGSGSQLTASEAAKGNGMPLVGAAEVSRVLNETHDSPVSFAWAVPRVSDVEAFNDCMDNTVKQWIDDMVAYFKNSPSFKAGSDGVVRKFGDGKVGQFKYEKDKLDNNIVGYPVLSADKGSLKVTAPKDLFRFEGDRVAGDSFNIVSFKTNDVYEVTNPSNKLAKATSSNNGRLRKIAYKIEVKSSGTNYSIQTIPGTPATEYTPATPTTYNQLTSPYSNSKSWSGELEGKWTDGYDVEWFTDTAEGRAEYTNFVNKYNAALQAANAWVATESAKQASTGGGGCKSGIGDVTASITVNEPVHTTVEFVPDTGKGEAVAKKDKDYEWSASYTFTVQPHTLCGPECGHVLPEINDVWQQSFNYDYVKIIGLSVLRLDQGAAKDTTEDESGLGALIGTTKLGVTRQTYYSSPTMSLAQANIFNYMGLQTDGKQDVTKATNEYFRSIATGVGTPWGNTRASEANRVKYWITNEDGSELTAKGPTFNRLTYKGNTVNTEKFANEVLSEWGDGAVKANDVVVYNFGKRSNITDGTSRGYKYNIDKRSWTEKVDGVWRGKAAYDLPWAKGFIYDGVHKDGTIDASGYSVSREYRNNASTNTGIEGIIQSGVKGWQGKGMTQKTLEYQTDAYEKNEYGWLFNADFYNGSTKNASLKQSAVRDWGTAQHTAYVDTRAAKETGFTIPGAEKGDVAPKTAVAKLWKENANKSVDTYAQTQPYDAESMLDAYTNTASDGGARIRETQEYKLMQAKRKEKVQATVISDALVLDLPNGLQPIMYHYKNAPKAVSAEERIPDTRCTFEEMWLNNLFTPNGWSSVSSGSTKDSIILGSYNGDLTKNRITGVNDVQSRLQWKTDEVAATSNMFIQTKDETVESPTGIIGAKLGAKVLNGKNINLYLAHNTTASTRILSLPVQNKAAVGASVQRTLLYNVTPINLFAENKEYETGEAEAFWETLVQWKDSSNHDYYGKYVDNVEVTESSAYLKAGSFIRLPQLLGNYGQNQRVLTGIAGVVLTDEEEESIEIQQKNAAETTKATLETYFKDSNGEDAYGAEEARKAQLEQSTRGLGIAGYNYDTTNTLALDGKYHKNMYNESSDLTGAAKGDAYVKDGNLGVPFILEGVTEASFKSDTAVRNVGVLRAGLGKTGYIQRAAYNQEDVAKDVYKLNGVIVHTPVTARSVQLMPLADWKDQRIEGQSLIPTVLSQKKVGCPGVVELCEHAYLDCKYDKNIEILRLNLVGTGNKVINTAANARTTGEIEFADSYTLTNTGLSSNGSLRTGVHLSELGGDYYKALDYLVTSKINYQAGTGEQMLFGFAEYGITLNTTTKKLAIRVNDVASYVSVAGEFHSGDTLKVRFGCENATLSKVWVNDELRTLELVGSATFEDMAISANEVGDIFYIGSWDSGMPVYAPTDSTCYESVLLERLAGSHEHTLACMSTITHHVGGNNAHKHTQECLGDKDSDSYLNGTINDWNNYAIDDETLRERLGDILWSKLGLPKVEKEQIINEEASLSVVPPMTEFAYTGDIQKYVVPKTGLYILETWGAEGGGNGVHTNALGGYTRGTVQLNEGQTVYVGVGGKGTDTGVSDNYGTGYNGDSSGGTAPNYAVPNQDKVISTYFYTGGIADISGTDDTYALCESSDHSIHVQSAGHESSLVFKNDVLQATTYIGGYNQIRVYYKTQMTRSNMEAKLYYGTPFTAQNYLHGIITDDCIIFDFNVNYNLKAKDMSQLKLAINYSLDKIDYVIERIELVKSQKMLGVVHYDNEYLDISSTAESFRVLARNKDLTRFTVNTYNSVKIEETVLKEKWGSFDTIILDCANDDLRNISLYVSTIGPSWSYKGSHMSGVRENNMYIIDVSSMQQLEAGEEITSISFKFNAQSRENLDIKLYAMTLSKGPRMLREERMNEPCVVSSMHHNSYDSDTMGTTIVESNVGRYRLSGSTARQVYIETVYDLAHARKYYGQYDKIRLNCYTYSQNDIKSATMICSKTRDYTNPIRIQGEVHDSYIIFDVSDIPADHCDVLNTLAFDIRCYSAYSIYQIDRLELIKTETTTEKGGTTHIALSDGLYSTLSQESVLISADGGGVNGVECKQGYASAQVSDVEDVKSVRAGHGYARISFKNGLGVAYQETTKYTINITGESKGFEVNIHKKSGTGKIKVSLYKGSIIAASRLLQSVENVSDVKLPKDGQQIVLSEGTYTLEIATTDSVTLQVTAYITGRGLAYNDIFSLPDIAGEEAWRTIPYYLSNGSRNPVYACNEDMNVHVEEIPRSQQFIYAKEVQEFIVPKTGKYTLEVWGAQGGGNDSFSATETSRGGAGGYAKGTILLEAGQTVQVITGSQGIKQAVASDWRGTQGGMTEIKLKNGVRYIAAYGGSGALSIGSTKYDGLGGDCDVSGVGESMWLKGLHTGNGMAKISWTEPTLCYTEVSYDNCDEPHHSRGHYDNDGLCYSPCMDDAKHDNNLVRNSKVNTKAGQYVSIDWDYTLYADSIDEFRVGTDYQLKTLKTNVGLGYYNTNEKGSFDTVRFIRGKYVKFPWITLYDGVLYNPGEWIVLGDRGDYKQDEVTLENKATGLGGNVQKAPNVEDEWNDKQAASYNVQNWSNYNQQIYKDLYKEFYDFYLPVVNNEMNLAKITYATVAVNSSNARDVAAQTGIPSPLSILSDICDFSRGSLENNKIRDMNSAAVGATKSFYADVVGRIGGLVIQDTTDVKFSTTFKQELESVADSKTIYDIDVTDMNGTKVGRLTKALQMSNTILDGDKVIDGIGDEPAHANLTTVGDWVGFTYAGDNARRYELTVLGNKLLSGELTVEVTDASNGTYLMRMADMTIKKRTDSLLSVTLDVKQTSAAVVIKPHFSLVDAEMSDVYVTSMAVEVGSSGFNQGLTKLVDVTKQNYYVTDITDVRGVYLNPTRTLDGVVEGIDALLSTRYASYYGSEDWIRMSDATQVRDVNKVSQRETPMYGTRAINTYGTRPWVQEGDSLYKALASAGGKALIGPLTAAHNKVAQYKKANDQISVGSKIYFDVTTLGSYNSESSKLKIIPTYYMVDVNSRDVDGAVGLIPVDIYQFTSSGIYQPVNIFGAPYGGFTSVQLDKFNQYRINVDWEQEAVGNNNRRMVTKAEVDAAQRLSDLYCENVYDIEDPYTYPGLDLGDLSTYPTPIGKTESPRKLPSGLMSIGGSQFIQQGYQTQTYIGSNRTYGVDKSGGLFAPYGTDPTQDARYLYWQVGAQRWHSTLSLPSDAVFVPLVQDPVTHKFRHRDVADIAVNAVDITKNYIICYLDIYAEGDVWTIQYDNSLIKRTLTLNDVDYELPVLGPVGPAGAYPYKDQVTVGKDEFNKGIPIGVFGGTRLESQADIIKVN